MPMMTCRVCGADFHIKPVDPVEWSQMHPGPEPHTGVCFFCWGPLSPGQEVRVRALTVPDSGRSVPIAIGDLGVITEVCRSTPDGAEDEYRVRQAGDHPKWTTVLRRNELQRIAQGGRPEGRRRRRGGRCRS